MGCSLSTSREAPPANDDNSVANIKTSTRTTQPTSIRVPTLSEILRDDPESADLPGLSTPPGSHTEMERPPSRMDWEASPSPPHQHYATPSEWPTLGPVVVSPTSQAVPNSTVFHGTLPRQVTLVTPQFQVPAPVQVSQIQPPPPPPPSDPIGTKTCMICTSKVGKSEVVYPCSRCKCPYCVRCLRFMFLAATKDESRMPPRCCNMVQLSVARPHLSAEEIAHFKAKYEEWNTPNRLYCPVPACSTFISPRLINAATKAATIAAEQERQQKQANESVTVVIGTGVRVDPNTPLTLKPPQQPVIVDCPTCTAGICTSCKQFAHPPLLCEVDSDIPPEFADLLKKWKVKRCPKCKAAIRRMYGCPHIRCRCGAQFCWFCLGPIDECRDIGCPEYDAADRDEAGYDTEEDNIEDEEDGLCEDGPDFELQRIDRRRARALQAGDLDAAVERRDQLDLGDEPNADEVDPWNCEHSWRRAGDSNQNLPKGALPKVLECHRCWREVVHALDVELNLDKLFEPDKAAAKERDAAITNVPAKIEEDNGARSGHECRTCGVVYCSECKDEVDVENRNRWEEFERKKKEASQDI